MNQCQICKEYYFDFDISKHRCQPAFECREEGDDDWHRVHAYDYEAAAEKASENMDDGSGEAPRERMIHVRKTGESAVKRFNVSFEYRIDYSADEIEGEDNGEDEEE